MYLFAELVCMVRIAQYIMFWVSEQSIKSGGFCAMGPVEVKKNQVLLTEEGNFFRIAADMTFYASQFKCSLGYI